MWMMVVRLHPSLRIIELASLNRFQSLLIALKRSEVCLNRACAYKKWCIPIIKLTATFRHCCSLTVVLALVPRASTIMKIFGPSIVLATMLSASLANPLPVDISPITEGNGTESLVKRQSRQYHCGGSLTLTYLPVYACQLTTRRRCWTKFRRCGTTICIPECTGPRPTRRYHHCRKRFAISTPT